MAEMTITLRRDPQTGKQNIVIKLRSDDDALPHEHEEQHRALVDKLIEGGILKADEVGKIVVERPEEEKRRRRRTIRSRRTNVRRRSKTDSPGASVPDPYPLRKRSWPLRHRLQKCTSRVMTRFQNVEAPAPAETAAADYETTSKPRATISMSSAMLKLDRPEQKIEPGPAVPSGGWFSETFLRSAAPKLPPLFHRPIHLNHRLLAANDGIDVAGLREDRAIVVAGRDRRGPGFADVRPRCLGRKSRGPLAETVAYLRHANAVTPAGAAARLAGLRPPRRRLGAVRRGTRFRNRQRHRPAGPDVVRGRNGRQGRPAQRGGSQLAAVQRRPCPGAGVGASLLHVLGPGPCFLANGLSFLAVLAALWAMDPTGFRTTPPHDRQRLRDGLSFLAARPWLLGFVLLSGGMAFFGWPVLSLLPALADKNLHAGPGMYGALLSAIGAGAMLAALLVASVGSMPRRKWFLAGGVALEAAGLALLALTATTMPALVCCALVGCGLILFFATAQAVTQLSSRRSQSRSYHGSLVDGAVRGATAGKPAGRLGRGRLGRTSGAGRGGRRHRGHGSRCAPGIARRTRRRDRIAAPPIRNSTAIGWSAMFLCNEHCDTLNKVRPRMRRTAHERKWSTA